MDRREDELKTLAALSEPLRRRLYLHVVSAGAPVSRDVASAAIGVPRSVAAFHLDKLAELGLVEVEYRRPSGRGGPGAGRPAKFYRRGSEEVAFSAPERHYDVAASLMARALADSRQSGTSPSQALGAVARDYGRSIGGQVEPGSMSRANGRSRKRSIAGLVRAVGGSRIRAAPGERRGDPSELSLSETGRRASGHRLRDESCIRIRNPRRVGDCGSFRQA